MKKYIVLLLILLGIVILGCSNGQMSTKEDIAKAIKEVDETMFKCTSDMLDTDRITTIFIRLVLTENWDADLEDDGLTLRFYGEDAEGNIIVPVGDLDVYVYSNPERENLLLTKSFSFSEKDFECDPAYGPRVKKNIKLGWDEMDLSSIAPSDFGYMYIKYISPEGVTYEADDYGSETFSYFP